MRKHSTILCLDFLHAFRIPFSDSMRRDFVCNTLGLVLEPNGLLVDASRKVYRCTNNYFLTIVQSIRVSVRSFKFAPEFVSLLSTDQIRVELISFPQACRVARLGWSEGVGLGLRCSLAGLGGTVGIGLGVRNFLIF